MTTARTDYEALAERYDAARSAPLESLDAWREAAAPHVRDGGPVLDVGAGTGLWSVAFARWFRVPVVAVEPSGAMRLRAVTERPHPGVAFVGGVAEQLPLATSCCGTAWLSTVVHHVRDLPACAAELRRVQRDGAAVLIRNAFADRADEIPWLEYFHEACEVALRRWPTVTAVAKTFMTEGYRLEQVRRIRHVTAPDLTSYTSTVALRADSVLAGLPDEEFAEGVARMETAARDAGPRPVVTGLDLLVLRPERRGGGR